MGRLAPRDLPGVPRWDDPRSRRKPETPSRSRRLVLWHRAPAVDGEQAGGTQRARVDALDSESCRGDDPDYIPVQVASTAEAVGQRCEPRLQLARESGCGPAMLQEQQLSARREESADALERCDRVGEQAEQ